MNLKIIYQGSGDLFEGDRTIWLRGLPLGAHTMRAVVKLMRLDDLPLQIQETFDFRSSPASGNQRAEDWGVTQNAGAGFVEVDFHARRTLSKVTGANISSTPGANLQVDIGGTFIDVNRRGALGGSDDLFELPDSGELPSLSVNKLRLTKESVNPEVESVTIRSVPSNITVKLGQTPPFWVRVGELATVDISPDFAEVLNAFLLTAPKENGYYQIPFVIHSDTLARLDIELNIDYVLEQAVLPPHLPEVVLPYNFSTLPGVDEKLTTVALPRQAIPVAGRSTAQIRGEFQPTRVRMGTIGEEPKVYPIRVAPDYSLAQPFQSDREIALTGIDIPLANTQTGLAGMNITLQADSDGKPFGDVLLRADVRVEKPLPGQSSWGSATLSSPFRILPAVRYWLVLQSLLGEAYWNAIAGEPEFITLQCSRDNGLSWRAAAAPGAPPLLNALLRLRDLPDRFSIPVQLQIGKGPAAVRRRLDEYAPLGRIEFSFDFAEKLNEHLRNPDSASPCGVGELLVNGTFEEPRPDDATIRLFGSADPERDRTVDLSHGIDLSVERFLTVSVTEGIPGTPQAIERILRIDCAGTNPALTTLEEILSATQRAARKPIFEKQDDQHLEVVTDPGVRILPWFGLGAPTDWQRDAGRVIRTMANGLPVILLDASQELLQKELVGFDLEDFDPDPVAPAVLAQRFPVSGTCRYLLRFLYIGRGLSSPGLGTREAQAPAQYQVEWLDGGGHILAANKEELGQQQREEAGLPIYETRLTAPAKAVEAKLCFIQQPPGVLTLIKASVIPMLEILANANFYRWESTADGFLPTGWSRISGSLEMESAPEANLPIVKLLSGGLDDTVLLQIADVTAGERYDLQVTARSDPPVDIDKTALPLQNRGRVELRWLGDNSSIQAAQIPLDGREFPTQAWSGVAPPEAKKVEIRLIQPKEQGTLFVEKASFMQADLINVPLIFLAETPGELTLSNMEVTYDLPESAADTFVSEILSRANAGTAGSKTTRLGDTQIQPGVTAGEATTSVAETMALPAETDRAAAMIVAAAPQASPLARMPAMIISGVGESFSKSLKRLRPPIKTIEDLTALDPETEIRTIPRERRLEMKTTAEMILAIDFGAEPFAALGDESPETLVTMASAELASRAGQSILATEQFQRNLRALRLLIKNNEFRNLHVSDLMKVQG